MAKAKAEALVLAALVLTSCFAAASSYYVPRRLLLVSGAYHRSPCNDERRPKLPGDDDDAGEVQGCRIPKAPPPPKGPVRPPRPMNVVAAAAPGSNN